MTAHAIAITVVVQQAMIMSRLTPVADTLSQSTSDDAVRDFAVLCSFSGGFLQYCAVLCSIIVTQHFSAVQKCRG